MRFGRYPTIYIWLIKGQLAEFVTTKFRRALILAYGNGDDV